MCTTALVDLIGRLCRVQRRLIAVVLVGIGSLSLAGAASAGVIVNINAVTNATTTDGNNDDPSAVAVTLLLAAGTYDVTPVGPAQGGAYTAWNAWGGATVGCNPSGANCSQGWMHWYRVQSDEFSRMRIQDGILYSTPGAALANSLSTQFTLAAAGPVYFFIFDTAPQGNAGGVSLLVSQVPEPAAVALLLAGLSLLTVARYFPLTRRQGSRALSGGAGSRARNGTRAGSI